MESQLHQKKTFFSIQGAVCHLVSLYSFSRQFMLHQAWILQYPVHLSGFHMYEISCGFLVCSELSKEGITVPLSLGHIHSLLGIVTGV